MRPADFSFPLISKFRVGTNYRLALRREAESQGDPIILFGIAYLVASRVEAFRAANLAEPDRTPLIPVQS
jgi:hypothetical protein